MADNEKKSIWTVFMTAPFVFMLVSLCETAVSYVTGEWDGIIFDMLKSFISSFISCGTACFYLRAVRRGTPDLADIWSFVADKVIFTKFMAVMVCKLIIDIGLSLAGVVFALIPVVNIIAAVAVVFVSMLFIPVWYLFAANPDYETTVYFKTARNIMGKNIFEYIGIVILMAISLIFVVMVMVPGLAILSILGVILFIPLILAASAIMGLIIASFMNKIIPEEWYYTV